MSAPRRGRPRSSLGVTGLLRDRPLGAPAATKAATSLKPPAADGISKVTAELFGRIGLKSDGGAEPIRLYISSGAWVESLLLHCSTINLDAWRPEMPFSDTAAYFEHKAKKAWSDERRQQLTEAAAFYRKLANITSGRRSVWQWLS
jgi:hypothetical protein